MYWPISALSVSEKLVYRFRFLTLYCLACFSNTRFTLLLASRVANAPIPVSLRLGNGVVRLKYWRVPVYSSWKKKKQSNLFYYFQCCYTTQGWKHPLLLLLLKQLANVHWFDIDVSTPTKYLIKFNYCDLFFEVPSALTKFAKVKFTQNIIALRYFEGGTYCAQSYQFCSYYLRALSNKRNTAYVRPIPNRSCAFE